MHLFLLGFKLSRTLHALYKFSASKLYPSSLCASCVWYFRIQCGQVGQHFLSTLHMSHVEEICGLTICTHDEHPAWA